jgi:hypothetical protein
MGSAQDEKAKNKINSAGRIRNFFEKFVIIERSA